MPISLQEKCSILQSLFDEQKQYINYFFNELDLAQAERCLELCLNCTGLIALTGVGKSGIIAEKIAMTLVSTGTRALYLPAMNFLHGDIGVLGEGDIVLAFSKSGETEELLALTPHIRRRGAKMVALVSSENSRLARAADLALSLPVEKELCPFDLAPTTSTEVQLLFGDVLAITLMRSKGFGLEQYALNHPSGAIGRQIALKVKDLMISGEALPLCSPDAKLVDVIVELSNKRCGCLLITSDAGELLGIFTDGDLRRSLQAQGAHLLERKMEELMTSRPLTIDEGSLAIEAIKIMQRDPKRLVMVLPVVSGGKAVGLLRMHDIIQAGF